MRPAPTVILHETDLDQLTGGDNLLQSGFWGRFKKMQGWTPRAFHYMEGDSPRRLLVLSRKLFKVIPISYIPHGPVVSNPEDCEELLRDIAGELQGYLPMGTLFIRFDIAAGTTGSEESRLSLQGKFTKAPLDIQPPDTTIVSLEPSLDELMAGMHKKTRYNIRLSGKKGVTIRKATPQSFEEDFTAWYAMYKETAARDKIALHSKEYYRRLFSHAEESEGAPKLTLWLAEHEGDLLAGIITSFYGRRATYLYGASSNTKRNLMPAYLLQWEAIQEAKKEGCTSYDMFGIPPTDNPDHPMHGLYRFKTGFGGEILHYLGSWDYPFSWSLYPLYKGAEALRRWYYKGLKKR